MIQEWINWNEKSDRKLLTIRVTFSNLRKYLFYRGIRTNEQDIREYVRFPKVAEKIKVEGKEFADELLEKKEFQDFGKNLAKNSVEKILEKN